MVGESRGVLWVGEFISFETIYMKNKKAILANPQRGKVWAVQHPYHAPTFLNNHCLPWCTYYSSESIRQQGKPAIFTNEWMWVNLGNTSVYNKISEWRENGLVIMIRNNYGRPYDDNANAKWKIWGQSKTS